MVSDAFLAIGGAILISYIFLYSSKTRWVRIVGAFAIMLSSVALGAIEDTVPMFVLMSINLIVGFIQLTKDAGALLDVFK